MSESCSNPPDDADQLAEQLLAQFQNRIPWNDEHEKELDHWIELIDKYKKAHYQSSLEFNTRQKRLYITSISLSSAFTALSAFLVEPDIVDTESGNLAVKAVLCVLGAATTAASGAIAGLSYPAKALRHKTRSAAFFELSSDIKLVKAAPAYARGDPNKVLILIKNQLVSLMQGAPSIPQHISKSHGLVDGKARELMCSSEHVHHSSTNVSPITTHMSKEEDLEQRRQNASKIRQMYNESVVRHHDELARQHDELAKARGELVGASNGPLPPPANGVALTSPPLTYGNTITAKTLPAVSAPYMAPSSAPRTPPKIAPLDDVSTNASIIPTYGTMQPTAHPVVRSMSMTTKSPLLSRNNNGL